MADYSLGARTVGLGWRHPSASSSQLIVDSENQIGKTLEKLFIARTKTPVVIP